MKHICKNKRSFNRRGLSLVELMVSLGVIGIVGAVAMQTILFVTQNQSKTSTRSGLEGLRQRVMLTLSSPVAWKQTIKANSSAAPSDALSCLPKNGVFDQGSSTSCCVKWEKPGDPSSRCLQTKAGTVSLLTSMGDELVANQAVSGNSVKGFDREGVPCSTFGQDSKCIVKLVLSYTSLCADAGCASPQTQITGQFVFSDKTSEDEKNTIPLSRYGFTQLVGTRSLAEEDTINGMLTCNSKMQFYQPDSPGADSNGCVDPEFAEAGCLSANPSKCPFGMVLIKGRNADENNYCIDKDATLVGFYSRSNSLVDSATGSCAHRCLQVCNEVQSTYACQNYGITVTAGNFQITSSPLAIGDGNIWMKQMAWTCGISGVKTSYGVASGNSEYYLGTYMRCCSH